MLDMQLYSGKRLDSMKSCELIALPQQMDIKQMAYASVIAEVTEALTEAHEPQEDIYELLALDFNDPQPFTVRGGDLMQLEQILYRFIVYQIDKPLKSLSFLAQLGL